MKLIICENDKYLNKSIRKEKIQKKKNSKF
jgi:hypothetical protein